MGFFGFGRKKKINKNRNDGACQPDAWATAYGGSVAQVAYGISGAPDAAVHQNMTGMTEPIIPPGQDLYGATEPLVAPAYDAAGATEPLDIPAQHLQSTAPLSPLTDGNYGETEPLHIAAEDFYGMTEALDVSNNVGDNTVDLRGMPSSNGLGETVPLTPPPSAYVLDFVHSDPDLSVQDPSNHSGDTCILMPQMPAATFFVVRTGQSVPMQGMEFSIGADPACCNLVLHNDYISKRQVTVSFSEGGYTVADHGSTNGTTLNGVKLQPNRRYFMRSGDRLILANEIVDFEIQGDSK